MVDPEPDREPGLRHALGCYAVLGVVLLNLDLAIRLDLGDRWTGMAWFAGSAASLAAVVVAVATFHSLTGRPRFAWSAVRRAVTAGRVAKALGWAALFAFVAAARSLADRWFPEPPGRWLAWLPILVLSSIGLAAASLAWPRIAAWFAAKR